MLERVRQWGYFASYYLGSLVGQRRPLLGGMKLTHECNLNCLHCPYRRRARESISFDQAVTSLNALHECGVRILIVEGGEPFLWADGEHRLEQIVDRAKRLFFSVAVSTNGTFPLEVSSDIVWVSIDGMAATHNRIRGPSFERILANIASSRHPRIFAHVTINALNWREVPTLVEFLAPRVKGITIQFHYPYEELDEELLLPFDRRQAVLDELIRLKRRGLPLANSYACLEALKNNRWRCRPWMIASVDPNGQLTRGCYVKNRGAISCKHCGFSAHAEISLAYNGVLESVVVGSKIFQPYRRMTTRA